MPNRLLEAAATSSYGELPAEAVSKTHDGQPESIIRLVGGNTIFDRIIADAPFSAEWLLRCIEDDHLSRGALASWWSGWRRRRITGWPCPMARIWGRNDIEAITQKKVDRFVCVECQDAYQKLDIIGLCAIFGGMSFQKELGVASTTSRQAMAWSSKFRKHADMENQTNIARLSVFRGGSMMHTEINTTDHQHQFGPTRTGMSEHPAALIIRARRMSQTVTDRQAKSLLALARRLESIVAEIRRIRGGGPS